MEMARAWKMIPHLNIKYLHISWELNCLQWEYYRKYLANLLADDDDVWYTIVYVYFDKWEKKYVCKRDKLMYFFVWIKVY